MDKFITELKIKAKSCNFGPLESSLVRDQIVVGVHDTKLKERLLREAELDLTRAESLAYASEVVHQQMKFLDAEQHGVKAVDSVSRRKRSFVKKKTVKPPFSNSDAYDCGNCGGSHKPRRCPAY